MPLVEVTEREHEFYRVANHLLDDASLSIRVFENQAPYKDELCEDAAGAYHDFEAEYRKAMREIDTEDVESTRLSAQVVKNWERDLAISGRLISPTLARYMRVSLKVTQLMELIEDYLHVEQEKE